MLLPLAGGRYPNRFLCSSAAPSLFNVVGPLGCSVAVGLTMLLVIEELRWAGTSAD